MPNRLLLPIAVVLIVNFALPCANSTAAEPPTFRTDADKNSILPWFRLVEGKFPPENSAHAIAGELIQVDHLERRFRMRVDRDDAQQAGHFDLPLDAEMLPYGSIRHLGAPAALQDVPLGTHVHGQFYRRDPAVKAKPLFGANERTSPEAAFSRCLRLEDDFSRDVRLKRRWKIDAVDLAANKLTVTLLQEGRPLGTPRVFDLRSSTRVLAGRGFVKLDALRPGQEILMNITWATLYGPGRATDIFLDDAARALATEQQLERHRNHIRERGLAGQVAAVDDERQIVTITFFDGVDPSLFDELKGTHPDPHGWPFSGREDDPNAPKGGICVARECLMTYDPVNDRKGGNILRIGKVPVEPGCSGVQIDVKCCMLLEGFRPGRVVRFYPAPWRVDALPREEQFHGRE